jgi:pimeloyl-ACP methyl ester carboxylesterase
MLRDAISATTTASRPYVFGAEYLVPVRGGHLFVARAGPPPERAEAVVLAVHGITASHVAWRAPVRELLERIGVCVLAPDLRGRGHSTRLPPHTRFKTHVDDMIAVLDQLGVQRAVLAGHSMGAFVVARVAAEHPGRATGVVLVDGGLALPLRPRTDPDEVLATTLGPALARLSMTFGSAEDYVRYWQAHPAFADAWNDDVEAYVRADLTGAPGALRSLTSEAAVRADGAALLLDAPTRTAAERVRAPLRLLRAPRGLLDDDRVMVPDEALDPFLATRPHATAELVEDCNHYTLLMGTGAPHVAAAIGGLICAEARHDPSGWAYSRT